jgi:hypothetical protein
MPSIQEQVHNLQRQVRTLQALVFILIILFGFSAFGDDFNVAKADFLRLPSIDKTHVQYFTTRYVDEEDREQLNAAFRFVVPSLSRTVLLDAIVPVQLTPTLYRVNIRNLQWGQEFRDTLKHKYPYNPKPGTRPLLVRADWFLQYVLDNTLSDNLYQLLIFGKELKTENEFLEFFKADIKSNFAFAFIEDDSGVAVNKTRILRVAPTLQNTPIWYTRDFADINDKNDPLENLTRETAYDASEVIGALPKRIGQTGEIGLLQAYGIFDGKGDVVTAAPPNVVVDYAGARGPELRNAISCFACHDEGLLEPSINALRRFNETGGVLGGHNKQDLIKINEQFNTSLKRGVTRWNEDFKLAVTACTGLEPKAVSAHVQNSIRTYDKKVTFEQAAKELKVTEKHLSRLLIHLTRLSQSTGKPILPARVVQLPHVPISREIWEAQWYKLWYYRVKTRSLLQS